MLARAAVAVALVTLALIAGYNTYRLWAIEAWLTQEVATRIDERGHSVPLNRADALAYFLSQDIVAYKAATAPSK